MDPSASAVSPLSPEPRVELAVVGGGLAGMSLAIACADAGITVALIDRETPSATLEEAFDGRSTALAFGSRQILAGIGAWPLLAARAEPILEIRVADGTSPLFLHYDHRDIGSEPLGWIIENRHLRRGLLDRLAALPTLRHLAPATVTEVVYEPSGAQLRLADGRVLSAQLVVAADGRTSRLREAVGIRSLTTTYPQTGIVCTVRHARPHRGIAVEHFLPAGPFAILPMTENRSSIVWTERADVAPRMMALDEAGFTAELARRFGDFRGELAVEGPRWAYPLTFLQAERYTAPRLALIGEAAHVIHPIAGQGLNLGIRDVAALAELIVDARRLGLDIGQPAALARYAGWRRLDTLLLAGVTDGLNRLFSNQVAPLALARDIGLAAVDRVPPLKRLLMRHAMGQLGELPRLARGERL